MIVLVRRLKKIVGAKKKGNHKNVNIESSVVIAKKFFPKFHNRLNIDQTR